MKVVKLPGTCAHVKTKAIIEGLLSVTFIVCDQIHTPRFFELPWVVGEGGDSHIKETGGSSSFLGLKIRGLVPWPPLTIPRYLKQEKIPGRQLVPLWCRREFKPRQEPIT